MTSEKEKPKNFQMKLNPKRRELIKKVQDKMRLGTKSKVIVRGLELYLNFYEYFKEKYEKFEEMRGEFPLR